MSNSWTRRLKESAKIPTNGVCSNGPYKHVSYGCGYTLTKTSDGLWQVDVDPPSGEPPSLWVLETLIKEYMRSFEINDR